MSSMSRDLRLRQSFIRAWHDYVKKRGPVARERAGQAKLLFIQRQHEWHRKVMVAWRDCAMAARIQRLSVSAEADTALFTKLLFDKGFKIFGLAEIAINRSVAHIGDLIEGMERRHDQFADFFAGHIAVGMAF